MYVRTCTYDIVYYSSDTFCGLTKIIFLDLSFNRTMADQDAEKNRKIFVGGLDVDTKSEDLSDYFSQWGEIVDAVVMVDSATKRSRGFGFVTFQDHRSVDDCLQPSVKPHNISGKEVEAKRAVPREESSPQSLQRTKKVFLGGLAPETTKEDISDILSSYGKIVDVQIMTEKGTDKPRGFGFATFDDYDSVDKVCNTKFLRIKDRDVEVKKAVTQEDMRRKDIGKHGSSSGGDNYKSAPYGRAPTYGGRGGGYPEFHRMGAYDYPRYPSAGTAEYSGMVRDYYNSVGGYDRGAVAGGYSAYHPFRFTGSGYPDYGSMYGQNASPMGTYNQSASAYGPSRGYPGAGDPSKDRDRGMGGGSRTHYHPYKRY